MAPPQLQAATLVSYLNNMKGPPESYTVTFWNYSLLEATRLYNEGVIEEEDGYQVIVDATKLQQCQNACLRILESHSSLDINAQVFFYLSMGRSDELAIDYLQKAVDACHKYEEESGKALNERKKFESALSSMVHAMAGCEQSDYGGVSVGAGMPLGSFENFHNGALRKSYALIPSIHTAPKLSAVSDAVKRKQRRANTRAKRDGMDGRGDEEDANGGVRIGF